MTAWMSNELCSIAAAEELEIAPARDDGTLRNPILLPSSFAQWMTVVPVVVERNRKEGRRLASLTAPDIAC
jgi:hypothetical protein